MSDGNGGEEVNGYESEEDSGGSDSRRKMSRQLFEMLSLSNTGENQIEEEELNNDVGVKTGAVDVADMDEKTARMFRRWSEDSVP